MNRPIDQPVLDGLSEGTSDEQACLWCRGKPVGEPHSFLALSGGATLLDRTTGIRDSSDGMEAFLELVWHGAHDGGEGEHREVDEIAPLVRKWPGGQFCLMFCSAKCLKEQLASWVGSIEAKANLSE